MIADPDRVTLKVTADDSVVSAGDSVSPGLIVTELVINALKHAFPDDRALSEECSSGGFLRSLRLAAAQNSKFA